MERLTKTNGRLIGICGKISTWIEESKSVGEIVDNAVERLAKYEDLGYSPEELKERLELAWMYEDLNK